MSEHRIFELGHVLRRDMPQADHAPYGYELLRDHADGSPFPGGDPGLTTAVDEVRLGLHAGTHMDALNHVAEGQRLFGGGLATTINGEVHGVAPALKPIIAPGILIDLPSHLGVEELPGDTEITPGMIENCLTEDGLDIEPGSVVLLRTGRDTRWEAGGYLDMPCPGPELEAAQLLSRSGVVAVGSDTMPFEFAPAARPLAVHVELLTRCGIFIFENLDLRALSTARIHRFLFVAAPLRLEYGTGSPVNPLALA